MKTRSNAFKMIAASLLLAAGGGLALPALAQPGPMGMGQGGMMYGPGHGQPGAGMDRLFDQVGASAEQRAQIKQIAQAAEPDLKAQREAGRALHEQMAQLLAQPNIDATAVEAQRQRMTAQHDQVSKRMTQMMLDSARVLTPEQRKKAVELMAQRRGMMERHFQERQSLDKPKS
jgi:Spy/CpxP family protein refolding chaperone